MYKPTCSWVILSSLPQTHCRAWWQHTRPLQLPRVMHPQRRWSVQRPPDMWNPRQHPIIRQQLLAPNPPVCPAMWSESPAIWRCHWHPPSIHWGSPRLEDIYSPIGHKQYQIRQWWPKAMRPTYLVWWVHMSGCSPGCPTPKKCQKRGRKIQEMVNEFTHAWKMLWRGREKVRVVVLLPSFRGDSGVYLTVCTCLINYMTIPAKCLL